MDQSKIKELLANNVKDVADQLPALSADELDAVEAAEKGTAEPRTGVLKAITSERKRRGGDDEAPAVPALPVRTENDWQHPDYTGPLTGAQGVWRSEHLQPWGKHFVKPAKAITK